FMRGRTLNDAFVILDEAQNTTSEQMKMFLTRLGYGSKAVITGDVTQIDLPTGRTSGLVEAMKVVGQVEGISFIYFDERDVVRHPPVQQIVKAYEAYGGSRQYQRAACHGATCHTCKRATTRISPTGGDRVGRPRPSGARWRAGSLARRGGARP